MCALLAQTVGAGVSFWARRLALETGTTTRASFATVVRRARGSDDIKPVGGMCSVDFECSQLLMALSSSPRSCASGLSLSARKLSLSWDGNMIVAKASTRISEMNCSTMNC